MRICCCALVGVVALILAACAGRQPAPTAPPPAPRLAPLPGLSVLLTWEAAVDLDLYLTDPTSETVYFANTPTRTGARLLRDTRCGDLTTEHAPFVEVANMEEPLPGRYRVGVDFIDTCGAGATDRPVGFRILVGLADTQRELTGTIALDRFQPIVLEFELRRSNSDGPLALESVPSREE